MSSFVRSRLFLAIIILALVSLACGRVSTPAPLPSPTPPFPVLPTPTLGLPTIGLATPTLGLPTLGLPTLGLPTPTRPPQATATPSPTVEPTMTSAKRASLVKATVRFMGYKDQAGKLKGLYSGSGTIISPDGYILTNCHVADPRTYGTPEYAPDVLIIELIDRDDLPPVPTYIVKVLAVDPILDLAVVKVDKTLNGTAVNTASLNLPYTPLGNSDAIRLGDPLHIFGYPSIGGKTITYTSGSVAGFDTQDKVGNRAWFKTDATIAGGNSGGQAANNAGELIGVPTRLGTESATKYTDCRRLEDTNGDGKIDEKDTCVPTGGFINSIRPVNWALPMIQAARSGQAYVSPYKTVQPTVGPTPSSGARLTLNSWAISTDDKNCPVNKVTTFPTGTSRIYAVFSWAQMTTGTAMAWKWTLNGRVIASSSGEWKAGVSGECYSYSLYNSSAALPDGDYAIEIYAASTLVGYANTKIGGAAPVGEVLVSGKVTDATNGQPIADATITILKPGVSVEEWLEKGTDDQVFTSARSSTSGAFQLPIRLQRGIQYGLVVAARGYRVTKGNLNLKADTQDTYSLTFQLSK
ncbi:MAG TPA: trypsin-like peptidase domain-containing protein [Anaerolineaceae bacterium]